MGNPVDITGQVFHRLTALHRVSVPGVTRSMWKFRCECGQETTCFAKNAMRGITKSCGCLKKEKDGAHLKTHGRAHTVEHRAWMAAKGRCYNTRNENYRNYGARGIYMSAAWLNNFPQFFKDMGLRPSPGHSLGRIDNDGPYSADNCRWETVRQQTSNTRNCIITTVDGERLTMKERAKRTDAIKYTLVASRVERGWSIERALTEPVHYRGRSSKS